MQEELFRISFAASFLYVACALPPHLIPYFPLVWLVERMHACIIICVCAFTFFTSFNCLYSCKEAEETKRKKFVLKNDEQHIESFAHSRVVVLVAFILDSLSFFLFSLPGFLVLFVFCFFFIYLMWIF